jgi:hypothetical protein
MLIYDHASKKVVVFAVMSDTKVYRPFFLAELTVTRITYLDMLENILIPQLDNDMGPHALLQEDGMPPHFLQDVCNFLDNH